MNAGLAVAFGLGRLLDDRRGGVMIYSAMLMVVGVGAGAVAVDFGRLELLRTEMQHAADAAALAGAVQLNGQDDSITRATNVAENAMSPSSNVPSSGNDALTIKEVKFYSDYATKTGTASGIDAKFIEVKFDPKQVNLMFAPVLSAVFGGPTTSTLNAGAVARVRPFVCHAPPLMMCDLAELDPDLDPTKPENIGRQIRLKEPQAGGGSWAPGNFGLLSLPDGSSGAKDISDALAAVTPNDCYEIDVVTATGSKTNQVKNGINARFDVGTSTIAPAPNVINYPVDTDLDDDSDLKIGDGVWDIDGYWAAKHEGATTPADLIGATRYQTYLFELGLPFARDGAKTAYPMPGGVAPSGYTEITPPPANVPVDGANPTLPDFDGVPQNAPASNGPARRLVEVAILQCVADGVNGHGTYPTNSKYVEMFITQEVKDPPNAAIYGEIVRSLSSFNDPEFHANAALIE
jgi:Flp pilus assembly protein TadG